MSKVVGDIAISVGADVGPLGREMKKGSRYIDRFGRDADNMALRFAKAGAKVTAVAGLMGAGILAAGRKAAASAREIDTLATVAGVGVEQFQKLAVAGESVGFSQEKMADIMKDVNDKFGDFMANRAGPLKDFFDNIAPAVGVTAEQFAKLSGPEALQLYVSSLERAGLSQQQMTFYMEALANDATALLPLMKSNGAAIREMGKAAEASGRIISEDMIKKGVELDRKFQELTGTISSQLTEAILNYGDELLNIVDWTANYAIPAVVAFGDHFVEFMKKLQPAIEGLQKFMGLAGAAMGVDGGEYAEYSAEDRAEMDANDRGIIPEDNGRFSNTGTGYVNKEGEWVEYGTDDPEASKGVPGINIPWPDRSVPLVKKGGGGQSSKDELLADLEAMRDALATEAEILEEWRSDQLEKLEEFREKKLISEEEYNKHEERITKEHQDRLAQLEKARSAAKLQALQGVFGDLSSLMSTENKKLFNIGKAAAIAEATVSGYQAAVEAWEKGMKVGGPPVAAAFTAASLAKTGALISNISSQSIGGGGGGGVPASPAAATAAPAAAPAEILIQGVNPNDLFTGSQIKTLVSSIQDELGDRGGKFVFS